MRSYDGHTGAALDGDRWLFTQQDTVDDTWRVVGLVADGAVLVHPFRTPGLQEGRPVAGRPGYLASAAGRTRENLTKDVSPWPRVLVRAGW
jgi:hypothetical protein